MTPAPTLAEIELSRIVAPSSPSSSSAQPPGHDAHRGALPAVVAEREPAGQFEPLEGRRRVEVEDAIDPVGVDAGAAVTGRQDPDRSGQVEVAAARLLLTRPLELEPVDPRAQQDDVLVSVRVGLEHRFAQGAVVGLAAVRMLIGDGRVAQLVGVGRTSERRPRERGQRTHQRDLRPRTTTLVRRAHR